MPLLYSLDQVARRYGVFPAAIDLTDPNHMRWVRRAWIFEAMESDRDEVMRRRNAARQMRIR